MALPELIRSLHDLSLHYACLMQQKKRDYFQLLWCAGQALSLARTLLRRHTNSDGKGNRTLRPAPADATERVRCWDQERADFLECREGNDEAVCRLIEGALCLSESLLPADQEEGRATGSRRGNHPTSDE
ncbi:MAG: hypothetical protein U0840_31130 [Gemmataceae bacterium]